MKCPFCGGETEDFCRTCEIYVDEGLISFVERIKERGIKTPVGILVPERTGKRKLVGEFFEVFFPDYLSYEVRIKGKVVFAEEGRPVELLLKGRPFLFVPEKGRSLRVSTSSLERNKNKYLLIKRLLEKKEVEDQLVISGRRKET